ncbi:MAG: TraB/GumN family protein [Rickettsiales bacterium]
MKKRSFLVILLVCATFWHSAAEAATKCKRSASYKPIAERYVHGIIFKISRCDVQDSYILGTMHADDPAITPIFNDASTLLESVDAVGVEFVEDEKTSEVARKYMFYGPTEPGGLHTLLSSVNFRALADALQAKMGIPPQAVARMRPWAAAIMLQFPESKADGISLDVRLQKKAKTAGKELFGLETPEEQYEVFMQIPDELQQSMLEDTIQQIPQITQINADFTDAYVARDLKRLNALAQDSLEMHSDPQLQGYMEAKLIRARNYNMTQRMQPRLMNSSALIAVGALHLMGEEGILPLLEKEGYSIESVK